MITLNYRDSRPIYEQIQEGLKRLIVTGAIAAEERLPSVRTLATQLSINPNTIQRAYAELEREGYCYSVPGKGSFVSGSVDTGEKRGKELKDHLFALAAELKFLGVPEEELLELVRRAGAAETDKKEGTL
ncbi:MAG: GntR family transcriptional regulator [Oscillibacter sp.]|nr:GntR family transcriptional regulator [Oscillibacter sp.]